IQGAPIAENHGSHPREIFIELCHKRFGVGFLRQRCKTNQVREQDGHWHAHTTKRAVVAVRVFKNFFDQIFRDVAFERPPGAQFPPRTRESIKTGGKTTRSGPAKTPRGWGAEAPPYCRKALAPLQDPRL